MRKSKRKKVKINMRLVERDSLTNKLTSVLNESTDRLSAREVFELAKEKKVKNGKNPEDIKIAAENDLFVLSAIKVDDDIVLNIHYDELDYNVWISLDQDYKGKVESAKVGWPSIGAVSSKEAVKFADLLTKTAEFAEMIDGKDYSGLFKEE